MFKFNFSQENTEKDHVDSEATEDEKLPVYESLEKNAESLHFDLASKYTPAQFPVGESVLRHAKLSEVEHAMKELSNSPNELSSHVADSLNSDLVRGVYEGGLKLWECTFDLLQYLSRENFPFLQKNVLDLGCGSGLLGIYALSKNASVDFQDYNGEVLDYLTIPNVIFNKFNSSSKFYSGDWTSFERKITANGVKYDVILTSETIYELSNYPKLVHTLERLLKPSGVIFLAAKTHYFGVGGGTRQFEAFLHKGKSALVSEVVWKAESGLQREILMLKFKDENTA